MTEMQLYLQIPDIVTVSSVQVRSKVEGQGACALIKRTFQTADSRCRESFSLCFLGEVLAVLAASQIGENPSQVSVLGPPA